MERDIVERLRGLLQNSEMTVAEVIADNERLRAEIERLRAENGNLRELMAWSVGDPTKTAEEIERLRDAVEQALDDMQDSHCVCEETKQMLCAALTPSRYPTSPSKT